VVAKGGGYVVAQPVPPAKVIKLFPQAMRMSAVPAMVDGLTLGGAAVALADTASGGPASPGSAAKATRRPTPKASHKATPKPSQSPKPVSQS
jgi:hypothetical protein